jgi:Holliday junction resolvase
MHKSNRAVGNAFEQELCEMLFEYGFWSHNLKQDNSGQPADIIAVRNKVAYLIDAKDCSSKGFDLRRVEENQITAMQLWGECGNDKGWFALRVDNEVYMFSFPIIMMFLQGNRKSIPLSEIPKIGRPLGEWVKQCK